MTGLADSNPNKRPKTTEAQTRAALRQAIWEASQHLSLVDLHAFVQQVLHEIEDDQP
jgi:hypothetical protein